MWISAEFKVYLIKEFKRLKADENDRLKLEWNLQRTLAKVNYHIHTDAIKENLIPKELSKTQVSFVYANEADLLNVALFGMTAKQWREANPKTAGNISDEATLEQLVVLSNLESINSVLINQGLAQSERLTQETEMSLTRTDFSNYIKAFNFRELFNFMGWDNDKTIQPIVVDNETFTLQFIFQKN